MRNAVLKLDTGAEPNVLRKHCKRCILSGLIGSIILKSRAFFKGIYETTNRLIIVHKLKSWWCADEFFFFFLKIQMAFVTVVNTVFVNSQPP